MGAKSHKEGRGGRKVAKRKERDLAGGMRQCQLKVNWPQKVVVLEAKLAFEERGGETMEQ